jgi:hypothetical protein
MTDAFIADPRRDTAASFVDSCVSDVTIRRWINLRDDERPELERGKDIDIVAPASQEMKMSSGGLEFFAAAAPSCWQRPSSGLKDSWVV